MNEATRVRPLHVPGRHVCQTCRRALNYDERTGQHVHPGEDWDHDPVPVPDLEFEYINEKCDFCFGDTTEWILPARPFIAAPDHRSGGDWGACESCGELILAGKWGSLARRMRELWPNVHSGNTMPPEIGQAVRLLWRELRGNTTGPLRRIER